MSIYLYLIHLYYCKYRKVCVTSFWRSFNEFNPIEKLVCNQLEWHLQTAYKNINTTLVITGTDDNNISTPNSLIIVEKSLEPGLYGSKMLVTHYSYSIQMKSIRYYIHFFRQQSQLANVTIMLE